MVSLTDRMGYAVDSFCFGLIDAGVKIQKGILYIGEEGSQAAKAVYGVEGFEKGSKAIIALLRMADKFSAFQGVFDHMIESVIAQRDLVYATLVFGSTAEFISVKTVGITKISGTVELKDIEGDKHVVVVHGDSDKEEVHHISTTKTLLVQDGDFVRKGQHLAEDVGNEKKYGFYFPNFFDEPVKYFYGIGNFFETGKFLNDNGVVSFTYCSQLATQLGSWKLFTLRGETWTFEDIPVFNTWTYEPKAFFVFLASLYNTYCCLKSPRPFSFENGLKFVSNVGKMILVSCAPYMLRNRYMVALTIADVAANNAAFLAFLWKRKKEREARLSDPT